jgi:hypothetical protein
VHLWALANNDNLNLREHYRKNALANSGLYCGIFIHRKESRAMITLNKRVKQYANLTFIACLISGYSFLPGSEFNKPFFQADWLAKLCMILLALAFILLTWIRAKKLSSMRFWVLSVACLTGMSFLGASFFGISVMLYWLGFFSYKSVVATREFAANSVHSYRQIRDEVEKS